MKKATISTSLTENEQQRIKKYINMNMYIISIYKDKGVLYICANKTKNSFPLIFKIP